MASRRRVVVVRGVVGCVSVVALACVASSSVASSCQYGSELVAYVVGFVVVVVSVWSSSFRSVAWRWLRRIELVGIVGALAGRLVVVVGWRGVDVSWASSSVSLRGSVVVALVVGVGVVASS
ncbi:hypothetical protein ACXZ9C_10530 [Streptococcus agalactiae]